MFLQTESVHQVDEQDKSVDRTQIQLAVLRRYAMFKFLFSRVFFKKTHTLLIRFCRLFVIRKCKIRFLRDKELRAEIIGFHSTWHDSDTLLPLDRADHTDVRLVLSAKNEAPEKDRAGARFNQQESAIHVDSDRRRSRRCIKRKKERSYRLKVKNVTFI